MEPDTPILHPNDAVNYYLEPAMRLQQVGSQVLRLNIHTGPPLVIMLTL